MTTTSRQRSHEPPPDAATAAAWRRRLRQVTDAPPVPDDSPPTHATEGAAEGLRVLLEMATAEVDNPPISVAVPFPSKIEFAASPAQRTQWARLVTGPWPLLCILAVQAVLSLRMVTAQTAFGDEALYLWAGHLEWAHWLHGTPIPAFPTWFSGAPVIYPPLGALADSIGGLVGARILSLIFILGATALLWGTASRLFGKRAAFCTAAIFASLGPTIHLGAFATYDAMALCLMAGAAWCATGSRTREDAAGWILGAGALIALANATKYASALFDPIVIAMAVLSAYPKSGVNAALRRGALLTGCTGTFLGALIKIGGPWYAGGISETTTNRALGGNSVMTVLSESWQWTAVVVVLSFAAILCSLIARESRSTILLTGILAAAAWLAPADQARIHTTTSLNKHVDFGAWFAAIAAGYALSRLIEWLRRPHARAAATVGLAACALPLLAAGTVQARQMVNWPSAANLIRFIRPLTSHGGRFLAETDDVLEYYLPQTTWRQWSNTYSITLPDGRLKNVNGSSAPYAKAIKDHYFSLIILNFTQTPGMDQAITHDIQANNAYRFLGTVNFHGVAGGSYAIWQYTPPGDTR